jgi:hypothetical protein
VNGRILISLIVGASVIAGGLGGAAHAASAAPTTERVSVASDGTQGNSSSGSLHPVAVSVHGRYVAFGSFATNLITPSSGPQPSRIILRDRKLGVTSEVDVSTAGVSANGQSFNPAISATGRYVAFDSSATNLVKGDTNGRIDVFVHDRVTGRTTRISLPDAGGQAHGDSVLPSISADGRYVAFLSTAANLTPQPARRLSNVYVHDRTAGTTQLISAGWAGTAANRDSNDAQISADGSSVVYSTYATNIMAGDTNNAADVFVRHLPAGTTTRVDVSSTGEPADRGAADATISGDGRRVAFTSASSLTPDDQNPSNDVYWHDVGSGTTRLVSATANGSSGDQRSELASISTDGNVVCFYSEADDLVSGDTNDAGDHFLRDVAGGSTQRISVTTAGGQALGAGFSVTPCRISGDGLHVVFTSLASNLVAGDTNAAFDVFIRNLG